MCSVVTNNTCTPFHNDKAFLCDFYYVWQCFNKELLYESSRNAVRGRHVWINNEKLSTCRVCRCDFHLHSPFVSSRGRTSSTAKRTLQKRRGRTASCVGGRQRSAPLSAARCVAVSRDHSPTLYPVFMDLRLNISCS